MISRRVRPSRAVLSALALSAAVLAPLGLSSPAPAASPSVPADVRPVRTLTSLLGTHEWYAQTYRGLPVVDGWYARHTTRAGTVTVDDGRKAVPATLGTTPRVTAAAADSATLASITQAYVAAKPGLVARPAKDAAVVPAATRATTTEDTLAVAGGPDAALVWQVVARDPSGTTRTLVDATTGAVRERRVLTKNADPSPKGDVSGRGRVFTPNPVVQLRDESLVDDDDANSAVPESAYSTVVVPRLSTGTTTLTGRFARIVSAQGKLASQDARRYLYSRGNSKFEQVNAYVGIDSAQAYIQSLGFTDVNNESQKLSVNTIPDDNSFYDPSADEITYGRGGVDDAEDVEVVWHEYGHAIQDAQVPGYGTTEQAGSIGEGFGDYWAVTMSQPLGNGFDDPCVMDWDATSYTDTVPHCLRRTDTGKTVADRVGEVHADGEIWSNALWDIHQAVGRQKADTLILEAQFAFTPNASFKSAARTTVTTAEALYGATVARQVRTAFAARGIL